MRKSGFTLIELSIVLVIIGLIVGGVLVGRDMINSSKLRKVISEVEGYKTAIQTFRLKFNCIPGDCPNATTFWGADASCPATPNNTVLKQATCNGDGNARIGNFFNGASSTPPSYEVLRSMQQLGSAQLINGLLSGVGSPAVASVLNVNSPSSVAYKEAGYQLLYIQDNTVNGSIWFGPMDAHVLVLGSPLTISPNMAAKPFLAPGDAFQVDSKMDDGLPGQGSVRSQQPTFIGSGCVTMPYLAVSSKYDFTKTTAECALLFKAGF